MRRLAIVIVGAWVLIGAAPHAAEFWDETPFLEWSDRDVQKMMTDSPWAHSIRINLPPALPVPADDTGRGGRGGGSDGGFPQGAQRIPLVVSWRSALPVKQALVRGQTGEGGALTDAQAAFLAQTEQFYVIAIEGLPPMYMQPGNTPVEAFLRRDDRDDIGAVQVAPQGRALMVGFPRGDVTPDDDEVELVMKLDRLSFKRKFKLRDMVFDGALAL